MMSQDRKPAEAARKRAFTALSRSGGAVGDCMGRAARRFARKVTQIYERHLEPHGLTLPQFGLLAHIASVPDDTFGALASDLGLDPSTLTRNLQALEKAGLVEMAVVEDDLRKRSVWPTETGARRLENAAPAWAKAQKEIDARLTASFQSALRKAEKAL